MRQRIDVLAVFNTDCRNPKPIRFRIIEHGVKKTIPVSNINCVDYYGAGGVTRIEYRCNTIDMNRCVDYKLLYYYRECRWEIEM